MTGFIEIASICSIPISYVVLRGQGIKLLSFIGKKCREKETLLPDIEKGNMNSWYEGAICLDPKCDLYLEDPVACVDYSSLYPSSMISENISHDSKVLTKIYDLKGKLLSEEGNKEYDNLDGYKYVNIEFDTYERVRKKVSAAEEKIKTCKKVCRYAQYPNNKKAIMPSILEELLSARKATRTLIKYKTVTLNNDRQISGLLKKTEKYHIINDKGKTEKVKNEMVKSVKDTYNDFMKNIFDKRQLGFKITANSLYGGCGAKTSAFYDPDIAASTTAVGRKLLLYAKRVIEEIYKNRTCKTLKYGEVKTKADCIYGDTDSCFFTFNLEDLSGNKIKGKKALEITIELAQEVGELATKMLKSPHDLEYEKTFLPFALLSKKRYVGMLYEFDPNKCKRKSMGIVLKRRDNAPIVKDIYGGIIDILMKKQNVNEAVDFAKECINKMIDGKYQCPDCKKLFKKLRYVDDHLKRNCKVRRSYNNIYTYDTKTFGTNKYGKNGGEIYIIQTDFDFNVSNSMAGAIFVGLIIASFKGYLVAANFMHLNSEKKIRKEIKSGTFNTFYKKYINFF